MIKTDPKYVVVLDTSVILQDSSCIYKFSGSTVVIPLAVLNEIDTFKNYEDEKGRNARRFARRLNELRKSGKLSEGVSLDSNGSKLKVVSGWNEKSGSSADEAILDTCSFVADLYHDKKVLLVTRDIILSIKAHLRGMEVTDPEEDRPIDTTEELYPGVCTVTTTSENIDRFYSDKKGILCVEDLDSDAGTIFPNCGIIIKSSSNPSHSGMGIFKEGAIHRLRWGEGSVGKKITAKNKEQIFAIELLMDPEIKLVSLSGQAGTGKSLVSVAAGLSQVLDRGIYEKLIVSRPIQPLGKDLGFLPGDALEKIDPWMAPIKDAIEFLYGGSRGASDRYYDLLSTEKLEVEPLTYIRGRSIPRSLFILDEGQNLSNHEMKTIISRIGEGSKIVITGDIYQIDHQYLDATNNGLTNVIEKFKKFPISGHVNLVKGERSELAGLAAQIL